MPPSPSPIPECLTHVPSCSEYAIAANAFQLSEADLRQLALAAPGFTFLPEGEQAALRQRVERELEVSQLDNSAKMCVFASGLDCGS